MDKPGGGEAVRYSWEELANPKIVKEILSERKIRARKYLGQNFLVDGNIVRKIIVAADPRPGDLTIEVGPGLGCLTLALSERCERVFALEKDPRLAQVLRELIRDREDIDIVEGDAREFDFEEAWVKAEGQGRVIMASNLPYGVAQTLMIRFLQEYPRIGEYTVTVQKEVGERLLAVPGKRDYGATTVMARSRADVSRVGHVSRNCFFPRPRVDSIILRLTRKSEAAVDPTDEVLFDSLVKASFAQRRKTLVNSLSASSHPGLDRETIEGGLASLGLPVRARAEDLSPADFAALTSALKSGPLASKAY